MRERETVKEHKNYLPALILTVVFWGLWIALIIFVDPSVVANMPIRGSYFVFFLLLFLAVWFLVSLVAASSRMGAMAALGVILYGYLRLTKLDTWWNVLLLLALLIGARFYFQNKPENKK